MHLFNLSEFGQRFGIDMTVGDFNSAVTAASKAATRSVASQFRFQDFETYTARRDFYRVDRMMASGNQQYRQFRLARGFIDGVSGFSAYFTDSILHVRNSDTNNLTDIQNVAGDGQSDYLTIDADQGLLTVHSIDMTGMWFVVTYNCGMDVATDDEYLDVPGWLQDAAEAQTILFLKQNRAFKTEDGSDDLRPIQESLLTLKAEHARIYPAAILPTSSEPGR